MVHHRFAAGAALLVAGLAGGCQSAAPSAPSPRDGVFVHISKGDRDPHALLMGLQMATVMQADCDVLVYVDVDGIPILLKDGRDVTYHGFASSRAMLQGLIDRKVPVLACPACLNAAGRTAEDLLPGVKVADKASFFSFTRGRILSIDY